MGMQAAGWSEVPFRLSVSNTRDVFAIQLPGAFLKRVLITYKNATTAIDEVNGTNHS